MNFTYFLGKRHSKSNRHPPGVGLPYAHSSFPNPNVFFFFSSFLSVRIGRFDPPPPPPIVPAGEPKKKGTKNQPFPLHPSDTSPHSFCPLSLSIYPFGTTHKHNSLAFPRSIFSFSSSIPSKFAFDKKTKKREGINHCADLPPPFSPLHPSSLIHLPIPPFWLRKNRSLPHCSHISFSLFAFFHLNNRLIDIHTVDVVLCPCLHSGRHVLGIVRFLPF